jgi:hypothetical protein
MCCPQAELTSYHIVKNPCCALQHFGFNGLPQRVDGVDKVADERVEALYWSAWHATSISFSQRSGWSGITLTLPTDA